MIPNKIKIYMTNYKKYFPDYQIAKSYSKFEYKIGENIVELCTADNMLSLDLFYPTENEYVLIDSFFVGKK